ncbi:TetR family transcriptional regulator [Chitinophaga skermanii]|uniref:TetR family transcriptional regulator n=1 Tax=Chitinophaga skermanii TaxID=331697 RepID=A0A327QQZ1_9BACT|nr:TetR/AcrR family transcriptional regulator [Chitinophaga skermanii]RAJ06661.1 TetR family transcriptional regulator [Chitinophaga skermanii]
MMNLSTKERILHTAVKLYNAEGIEGVTVRHIAGEMGISHGNLQYHYRTTNDIILAIYQQLEDHFSRLITDMQVERPLEPSLIHVFKSSVDEAFDLMYKYRFIFLDFVAIVRRVPAIKSRYIRITQQRVQQFEQIFHMLIQKRIFRRDIPAAVYRALTTQVFIVADFWLSSNAVNVGLPMKAAMDFYKDTFWKMLYPYFTSKGLRLFSNELSYQP